MKKAKILSGLMALTLTAVSAAPLFANASALSPNVQAASLDSAIEDVFGEDTIVEYSEGNGFYIILSPDKIGDIADSGVRLKIKLKKNSELSVSDLNQMMYSAIVDETVGFVNIEKSAEDDNTYILKPDPYIHYTRDELETEIYPHAIEILSECEDVVSVDKYCNIAVESTDDSNCRIHNFSIVVSPDIELDYNNYSNYTISERADGKIVIIPTNENTFYNDFYNAYKNLREEYGSENVGMGMIINETALSSTQSVGGNVYTAPITGDVNADGDISISDAVAISAYVGNPQINQIAVEQRRINGDVHNTGDGLTANDALLIQQYLAGDIENF